MPTLDLGSVVGPKGDQGDPGPRGKQGVQGNPGTPATINGVNALTITAGDNITLKQEGSNMKIGAVVPGKNLIINGDFRKPVNRNGKTEYYVNEWTIDLWRGTGVSVLSDHIRIFGGTTNRYFANSRIHNHGGANVELLKSLRGRTVTISLMYGGCTANAAFGANAFYANPVQEFLGIQIVPLVADNAVHVATITYTVPEYDLSKEILYFNPIYITIFGESDGASKGVDLYAVVLEEGDHQTHFRQNADGQWEIIDPIDYDTQYLLCSQYSPITGKWVGSQHSNPSLLDNWYFPIPINQSNIASGEFWGEGHYGIDRWRAFGANLTKWVKNEGIYLCDGESINAIIEQMMEQDKLPFGETVTLSALVDNQLICGSFTANGTNFSLDFIVGNNNVKLQFLYNYISPGICNARVWKTTNTGGNALVKAAKLELGPVSTLAHKEGDAWVLNDPPPDYALELAKCQRYQMILRSMTNGYMPIGIASSWTGANRNISLDIPLTASMRAVPEVTAEGEFFLSGGDANDIGPTEISSISTQGMTASEIMLSITLSADIVSNRVYRFWGSPNAKIILDANL